MDRLKCTTASKKLRQGEGQQGEDQTGRQMQVREKVGKSQNIVFFPMIVAPEDRKVGSLKRRVRSQR